MSDELSFKQVAINKNLESPDEFGLITMSLEASLKGAKGKKPTDLYPTDEDMALISEYSLVDQEKENFIILRNVDPIGDPKAVDSHMDKFSKQAEKNLVEGAPGTPLLINHDHDITNPPVGFVIASKLTNKGPRETIAIPLDNGNDAIVKGLLNGSINKLSVGIQVYHADTLCNSCEKATSIYASACPHMPGQKDEKGNITTKTINKVARYLERSLVNIPARLGTSVKALENLSDQEGDPFTPTIELNESHFQKGGLIGKIVALEASTDSQNSTSDTITPVNKTTEDIETVADPKEEVKEEVKADEVVATPETEVKAEVPAEETAKAEEVKVEEKAEEVKPEAVTETKELKVSLSDESEALIKSVMAEASTKFTEVVTKQDEKIANLSTQLEAAAKSIETLVSLQAALTETVDKAVGVSTEEVLIKFMEMAKAATEMKKAQAPAEADLLTQFGV